MPLFNKSVLMSGADYFSDQFAINAHMNAAVPVDVERAKAEHEQIRQALLSAGVTVKQVPPPEGCQDGVYTANWGLCRGDTVVLSRLPNKRQAEEPYAQKILRDLAKKVVSVPNHLRFSGQGDALPCGDFLFIGSRYRTDEQAHSFIGQALNYQVISLQTIPKRRWFGLGPAVINRETGWPDSYYYDIDLALAVLKPPTKDSRGLIAWCPEVFTAESRAKLQAFTAVDKLEVSRTEATKGFACNLVSTGETVIMSARAPRFKTALESHGFKTITPEIVELGKGGGYIRCTTLTLDNA